MVIDNDEQQITCEINHGLAPNHYKITIVFAKCKDNLRRPLWDRLLCQANADLPWCTVGDFNVISNIEEKLGGVPYNMQKSFEFSSVAYACGLIDQGNNGHSFTWSNLRGINSRVWKKIGHGCGE